MTKNFYSLPLYVFENSADPIVMRHALGLKKRIQEISIDFYESLNKKPKSYGINDFVKWLEDSEIVERVNK